MARDLVSVAQRHLRRGTACLAALMLAVPAGACLVGEGLLYDSFYAPDAAIGIGILADWSITSDAEGDCLRVTYTVEEAVVGELAEEVKIATCREKGAFFGLESETPEGRSAMGLAGYVTGSRVMFGVVPDGAALRHLYPDCWGALHWPLDDGVDPDRLAMIEALEAGRRDAP